MELVPNNTERLRPGSGRCRKGSTYLLEYRKVSNDHREYISVRVIFFKLVLASSFINGEFVSNGEKLLIDELLDS